MPDDEGHEERELHMLLEQRVKALHYDTRHHQAQEKGKQPLAPLLDDLQRPQLAAEGGGGEGSENQGQTNRM